MKQQQGNTSNTKGLPIIFDNESICVLEVAFADPKGRWRLASIMEEERKTDLVASRMVTVRPFLLLLLPPTHPPIHIPTKHLPTHPLISFTHPPGTSDAVKRKRKRKRKKGNK